LFSQNQHIAAGTIQRLLTRFDESDSLSSSLTD